MADRVVSGFGNFPCEGCGETASISTRIGTPIPCPCGLVHTAKGVVVETTGECADPKWQEQKQAAGRAARTT